VGAYPGPSFAFGGAAFALHLVPVAGWLCLPACVAGAVLLASWPALTNTRFVAPQLRNPSP